LPTGSGAGKQRLGNRAAASCTEAAVALLSSSVIIFWRLAVHDARLQQLLRPLFQQRLRCASQTQSAESFPKAASPQGG